MKQYQSIFLAGCLISLFLFAGCDQNAGYQFVDLSEKEQQQKKAASDDGKKSLKVAVAAMISPKETLVYYEELLTLIGKRLGYTMILIQRKTYSEINELFPDRLIDLAFVCSGPYANEKTKYRFEGIAIPIIRGEPYYQSYLIVQKDSPYHSLDDLKGKVFAFTDPDSNSGALVPRYWLLQENLSPETFFGRVTYTYSHDNSILAVSKGLVDGAAVDGHQWEFYHLKNPSLTAKTRVIRKSDRYGSPPLVVSSSLDPKLKSEIQQTVLTLHQTEEGKKILENLMIDRFEIPREEWYENVQAMYQAVGRK